MSLHSARDTIGPMYAPVADTKVTRRRNANWSNTTPKGNSDRDRRGRGPGVRTGGRVHRLHLPSDRRARPGSERRQPAELAGAYGHTDLWHEPFVLFGYLAGITQTLELVTSILILPQRQTALVAKQAAEVDVLSGGRLRLGIGVGWNDVEYEALGQDFRDRGQRCEEQIEVLRALWTSELVTYEGRWHKITDAGLNPMPVQRPIPIWIGGGPGSAGTISAAGSERVLKRIARMADGWFPSVGLQSNVGGAIARLHELMRDAGARPVSGGGRRIGLSCGQRAGGVGSTGGSVEGGWRHAHHGQHRGGGLFYVSGTHRSVGASPWRGG